MLDKAIEGSYSWRKRVAEIPENDVTYEKYEIIAEDKSYKNLYHLGEPHEFFLFLNTYLKPNNFNLLSMTFASDKEHNDTVVVLLAKPNPAPYSEVESNVHDFFSSEDFVECFKAYYQNEIPSTIRGVSFHYTWVKDYYTPISVSE